MNLRRSRLGPLLGGLAVLLGGLAMSLAPLTPADAHAAVVASTPAQGSVLGFSPTVVTVTFSEPVSLVPDRVRVLAPDGKRINTEDPSVDGSTLRIPIRVADRPLGTYLVSYRVVSADSHPVGGGYTFSVGAPSATVPEPPDESVHRSVQVAVVAAKYLGYAGLALTVGPLLLLGALWPRRMSRRGAVRLVHLGLGLVAVATIAGLWLQAPYRSGAALLDVSGTELRQVLGTGFGMALLARLGILLLVTALLRPLARGPRRIGRVRAGLLVPLGLAGAVTWPLTGHAVAAPTPVASIIADVIHLAAMAVWLGGLVALLGFPLRAAHPRVLAVILPVWSRWATIAVIWLVAGGLVQALIEIGTPGALFGTDYGRIVLGKAALLLGVLTAAAYARRAVRRRRVCGARPAGPDPTIPPGGPAGAVVGRRRLRRAVGIEVVAIALVLGLSAVLVQTTPARNADIEVAASRLDGLARTLESPIYTLQFDIFPVQLGGNNTVHAYVYTPSGQRLPVVEWTLTTSLPDQGVEPVSTPLLGLEPHHAMGAVAFPIPGDWRLHFTIRVSEIDQATVTTTVPVR